MSHCVWPFSSGEVCVQSYNTLLTLSGLLDAVDGVVIVRNDVLHSGAQKMLDITRHAIVHSTRLR